MSNKGRLKSANRCKVAGCTRKVHTRGVCHACYLAFARAVEAGETTWEQLVAGGLVKSKHNSPATAALSNLKASK